MRTATDALRSLHRFVWSVLGDEWEIRFHATEGTLVFPYVVVSPITPVDGAGPATVTDLTQTFSIHAYPLPGADPEVAKMQVAAIQQQFLDAFFTGWTWVDPVVPPPELQAYVADRLGFLGAGSYEYVVTAVSFSYEESLPSAPVAVTCSGSTNGVYVAWDAMQGARTYRLYRSKNGGPFQRLVDQDESLFIDDGLTAPTAVPPPTVSSASVQVRSAKQRVPLYDYEGVPLDGPGSVSYKRGPSDFLRVVSCTVDALVDPEDDRYWLVAVQPRLTWRRVARVPSATKIVEEVRLREVVA